MRGERFVVRQWLTVHDFRRNGVEVEVMVADERAEQHRIVFSFDDPLDALGHVERLEVWRQASTPLTYERGVLDSVLLDDAEAFRLAWDGPFV